MRLIVSKDKNKFAVVENIERVTVCITAEGTVSLIAGSDLEKVRHEIRIDGISFGEYSNMTRAKTELKNIMDYMLDFDACEVYRMS